MFGLHSLLVFHEENDLTCAMKPQMGESSHMNQLCLSLIPLPCLRARSELWLHSSPSADHRIKISIFINDSLQCSFPRFAPLCQRSNSDWNSHYNKFQHRACDTSTCSHPKSWAAPCGTIPSTLPPSVQVRCISPATNLALTPNLSVKARSTSKMLPCFCKTKKAALQYFKGGVHT